MLMSSISLKPLMPYDLTECISTIFFSFKQDWPKMTTIEKLLYNDTLNQKCLLGQKKVIQMHIWSNPIHEQKVKL